jgi:hypothetical protein
MASFSLTVGGALPSSSTCGSSGARGESASCARAEAAPKKTTARMPRERMRGATVSLRCRSGPAVASIQASWGSPLRRPPPVRRPSGRGGSSRRSSRDRRWGRRRRSGHGGRRIRGTMRRSTPEGQVSSRHARMAPALSWCTWGRIRPSSAFCASFAAPRGVHARPANARPRTTAHGGVRTREPGCARASPEKRPSAWHRAPRAPRADDSRRKCLAPSASTP